MDDKMMETGKAYIVFTPTGIGKTKKIDIELINLAEGDRQVMALAQGVWWFAKKNSPLATYIGMKEIETMMSAFILLIVVVFYEVIRRYIVTQQIKEASKEVED